MTDWERVLDDLTEYEKAVRAAWSDHHQTLDVAWRKWLEVEAASEAQLRRRLAEIDKEGKEVRE